MSEEGEGLHGADLLIGAFLILFGACIGLAGGACTIAVGSNLFQLGGFALLGFEIVPLLFGIAMVAGGFFLMRFGLRVGRGVYRRKSDDREAPDA